MNPWEQTLVIDLPPEPPQPDMMAAARVMGEGLRAQIRDDLVKLAEGWGKSRAEAEAWADEEMAKPLPIRIVGGFFAGGDL